MRAWKDLMYEHRNAKPEEKEMVEKYQKKKCQRGEGQGQGSSQTLAIILAFASRCSQDCTEREVRGRRSPRSTGDDGYDGHTMLAPSCMATSMTSVLA